MSEQIKHSPGPWSYWHDECASCEREGKKEFVIDGPPGAEHGQFSHEPDARLIAAAPDLATELRDLVDWLEANQRTIEGMFSMDELLAGPRAALSKALCQDGESAS